MPAILTDPAQLAAAHARFTQALQASRSLHSHRSCAWLRHTRYL